MTTHAREHKNIGNLETFSEACYACALSSSCDLKVERWLGKLRLWASICLHSFNWCTLAFPHRRSVLPLGLRGFQAAAGETQLKCLVFTLTVGSWRTDMKQVKALKPDVPSRTVAFNVFMTWEPPKHFPVEARTLCGILNLIDDNWLAFLSYLSWTYLKLFTDPQGYPDHMLKPNENKSNLICFILSKLPTHISPVNTTKISNSFWHTVHLGLAQQMSHWDTHKLKMCSQVSLSHLNLQELVHHWYYRRASFPYQKAPEH